MRPPVTRKSPEAAQPLCSAQLLRGLALVVMLVGLQQPWSDARLGAQSALAITATGIAVLGTWLGMLSWANKLRVAIARLLWVSQLPLLAVVIWFLLGEIIGGAGFGVGAALALAGALLAAQNLSVPNWQPVEGPGRSTVGAATSGISAVPTSSLLSVSSVSLAVVGLAALAAALAAPIRQLVLGAPWQLIVSTTVFAGFCLFLAWWQLVPIVQLEIPAAKRVFPPGKWFPHTSVEQVTAHALLLAIVGAIVAITAGFAGNRNGWSAHLVDVRLAVWFAPALAASAFSVVAKHWRRCAPMVLRRAIERSSLFTGTAIGGYLLVATALRMVSQGFTAGLLAVMLLAVLVPGLGWADYQGVIRLASLGTKLTTWANNHLWRVPGEVVWSVDDLPLMTSTTGELWSGAHRWVGPTLAQLNDDGSPVQDPTALGADDLGVIPSHDAEAQICEPELPAVTEAVAEHRGDTTTHLQVAPNHLDGHHPGESNPMFTESGRIVIPLARPKWTPQQAMDGATHPELLTRIALEAPHLRPQVARNPAASPELLDWLAELDDPDVNAALKSLATPLR